MYKLNYIDRVLLWEGRVLVTLTAVVIVWKNLIYKLFQKFSKITFCITLTVICMTPASAIAAEDGYYRAWEARYSGKYKLVWYYNTRKDFEKNQPNKALVGDKEFVIHSDVRPPVINSVYQLEYSKVNEGEEVLDLGTGSGVHAIFAAEKAKRIVATDIFEPAVENAKVNARLHGVDGKIDFRVGDLFEPLNDDEKFDVIFFNINFPFKNDDTDRNSLHERIFAEIRQYMKPNARIYYQTSFVKNIPYIYDMLGRNNFRIMEMHMMYMTLIAHEPLFLLVQSR